MGVQRAFGAAGGARGVEPETGVVRAGGGRLRQRGVLRQQGIKRYGAYRQGVGGARHDEVLDLVRGLHQGLLQHWQERPRGDDRLRPAVLQHEGVIVGGEQGVNRHRHDAGVQRPEKAHRPVVDVVHQQQHALFTPHATGQQRPRQARRLLGQRAVAQAALVVNVGGLAGTLLVEREEVLGKIEHGTGWLDVGNWGHGVFSGWR